MKQSDQDIFRHRAEELADAAKRVIDRWAAGGLEVNAWAHNELMRELDQKRRRFEEVR